MHVATHLAVAQSFSSKPRGAPLLALFLELFFVVVLRLIEGILTR